jgi:hypothetical protein
MDADHFDRLTKFLSTATTRRAALRAAAGLFGGLATAGLGRGRGQAAGPAPPIPPPSLDPWPACSEARTHYCVAAFSVDGVNQLVDDPDYTPLVSGTNTLTNGTTDRLNWDVWPRNGELQAADLSKEIVLRIRAGRLEPVFTAMRVTGVRLQASGDATSGWEIEVRGRPAPVPGCNTDPLSCEQATTMAVTFQGESLHRTNPTLNGLNGFEGYLAGSNLNGFGSPRWQGDAWHITLHSPHLMPDGSITHGSYRAWMTPGTLQRLKLTTQEALAGGLAITRIDGGVESAVNAAITALDGGVLIDIPDLTFSSPTIAIGKRGGGKCAKRCRKGRVCKKGRCVKKKGKGNGKKKR